MNRFAALMFTLLIAAAAPLARADYDLHPYAAGGQIHVGGTDDLTGFVYEQDLADGLGVGGTRWIGATHPGDPLPPLVFGYGFGEDIAQPFFITDPGVNAAAGSGLTPGAVLTFRVLGSLQYWDGTSAVSFGPPVPGTSLHFELGANDVALTGSSGAQNGFVLQTIEADGSMHKHIGSELLGPGLGDPTNGIYLADIQLFLTGSALTDSGTIHLVFNNGMLDEIHDQAIDFLGGGSIPEPASLTLLGAGGILILGRRRGALSRHRH